MSSRDKTFLSVGFLIVSFLLSLIYIMSTPYYTLFQVGRALKTHDSRLFFHYVDFDRVISSHLTSAKLIKVPKKSHLSALLSGIEIRVGKSIRNQIKHIIADYLSDPQNFQFPSTATLIVSVKEKRRLKDGTVLFVLKEPKKDRELHLTLERRGTFKWIIVGIDSNDLWGLIKELIGKEFDLN